MNPMKKMFVLLSVVVLFTSLNKAVAQNDAAKSKPAKVEWKEMKHFHSIMSKTFHPSEKGDLKPVKENAGLLTASAKAWAASAIPDGYNKNLTPKILGKLITNCEDLEASVKAGADDETLKKKIAGAHEVFHEIVEKCVPGKEDHDHHEGHDHK